MKKLLLLLLILFVVGGSVFADMLSYPPALGNGGAVMLDFGIGWTWYSWAYSWLSSSKISVPPIFLDAQFAIPNLPLSVGLSMAYWQYKTTYYYSYYGDYAWRDNYLFVGAKADWHFGFDMNVIDFYAGLTLGYNAYWHSGNYYSYYSTVGSLHYGAHAGAHFYFTPVFGAMAEVGYPFIIKAGVSFKFGGSGGSSGGRYVVDVDSLNVRSGPSADYSAVGSLPRGTRVEVLNSSGSWWEIRSGSIRGYVNSSYLRRD
jgi:hypothetical protein